MAENIPNIPTGAVPPKKETGKVQPKKETVRINLPPKPSAAPTIKLPTLPPGGPAGAPPAAAPAPALSTAAAPAPAPAAAAAPRATPAPAAIAKGDAISISVSGDGFAVAQPGEALESGPVGAWIKVRTLGANAQPMRAKVLRPGQAGIDLP